MEGEREEREERGVERWSKQTNDQMAVGTVIKQWSKGVELRSNGSQMVVKQWPNGQLWLLQGKCLAVFYLPPTQIACLLVKL